MGVAYDYCRICSRYGTKGHEASGEHRTRVVQAERCIMRLGFQPVPIRVWRKALVCTLYKDPTATRMRQYFLERIRTGEDEGD